MAVSNNSINTEIGVDIRQDSVRSVKEMTRDIIQLGRETKVAESHFKSQGDTLNASKARYEGLTKQVVDQTAKVEQLKKQQEAIKGTTEEDAKKRADLSREIAKNQTQLSGYVAQQEKAKKAYDYEASGLAKLKQERDLNEKSIRAEVAALEAEGKSQEAATVKRNGAKVSIQNLNSQLEKQIAELDKLKKNGATQEQIKQQEIYVNGTRKNLANARKEYEDLSDTGKKTFKTLENEAESSNKRMGDIIKGSAIGSLIATGARKAMSVVTGSIDSAMSRLDTLDHVEKGFERITGSAKIAREATDELSVATTDTTYALDSATNAALAFGNADMPIKKATDTTKAFMDALTTYGDGTSEQFDRVMLQMGQMANKGKVNLGDLNSAIEAGIPVWTILEKQMGKSKEELMDMVSKGKISSEEFFDAFKKGTKDIEGAAKSGATTWSGALAIVNSRMRNAVAETLDSIKKMFAEITGDDNGVFVFITSIGTAFKDVFRSVVSPIMTLVMDFIKVFKVNMHGVFSDTQNGFNDIWQVAQNVFGSLFKVLSQAAKFLAIATASVIDVIATVVEAAVFGFKIAGDAADDAKKSFDFQPIIDIIVYMGQKLNEWRIVMVEILDPLSQIIGYMAQGVFQVFSDIITGISDAFNSLKITSGEAKDEINPVADALWKVAEHKEALKTVGVVIGGVAAAITTVRIAQKLWNGVQMAWINMQIAYETAMALSTKGITAMTTAIKVSGQAIKAHPVMFAVGVIVAIGAALYSLYKHNDKFKAFVDGVAKSAMDAFKAIGKFFSDLWNGTKKVVGKIIEFIKNDWKELLLLMVNPLAGIFALLYKHNAKFKNFVDDVVKMIKDAFDKVVDFFKSVTDGAMSFGKKIVSGIGNIFNKISDVVVKSLKIIGKILLYTVAFVVGLGILLLTPIVKFLKNVTDKVVNGVKVLFSLIKKVLTPVMKVMKKGLNAFVKFFVDIFKKIAKGADQAWKGIIKNLQAFGKTIDKLWKSIWNPVSDFFTKMWKNMAKFVVGVFHDIQKRVGDFGKAFQKIWNGIWKSVGKFFSDIWDGIVKELKKFINWIVKNMTDFGHTVDKIWKGIWNPISKFFGDIWNGIKEVGAQAWNWISDKMSSFGTTVSEGWTNTWQGMADFFSDIWDTIKGFARDGINGVIGIINGGIGGINWVINKFGGPEEAIQKISEVKKFATGTYGAPEGLAMVNDGTDSPTGQELIIDNQGRGTLLSGRNRLVEFSGGETVIPAAVTDQLLSGGVPQFAKGTDNWFSGITGWVSDIWDTLKNAVKKPFEFINDIMTKKVTEKLGGTSDLVSNLAPSLGKGFTKGVTAPFKKLAESLLKKREAEVSEKQLGQGVMSRGEFDKIGHKAAALSGLRLNGGDLMYLWKQALRESSANPSAVQGEIGDINNQTGDLAKGLFQFTSATFKAFARHGHGKIFDALDQFMAVFNNTNWRRDMPSQFANGSWPQGGTGWGPTGVRRFANGGLITKPELIMAGEEFPELVIPLDTAKKSRAVQVIDQAKQYIGADDAKSNETDLTDVINGMESIVALLAATLGVNKEQLSALKKKNGGTSDLLNSLAVVQDGLEYQRL